MTLDERPEAAGPAQARSSRAESRVALGPGFLAWLPILGFLLAVGVLTHLRIEATWNPPLVLPILNASFLTLVSFVVSGLAAGGFLVGQSAPVLLLGCGALALGLGGMMAGLALGGPGPEPGAAVYNTAACLSALCHLLGATGAFVTGPSRLRPGWVPLVGAYVGVTILISAQAFFVHHGLWPVHFIEGQGDTIFGYAVVWTAAGMFVLSATLLKLKRGSEGRRFRDWYALGLTLIAVGLAGVSLGSRIGDPLDWLGRSSQYVGGACMLVAALSSVRESRSWLVPLEAALRESEGRYQSLVELSPDAILVHAEGRYLFANPAATRLFGAQAAEDLIGRSVLDLVHPDDRELVARRIERTGSGLPAAQTEVRILRLDGTVAPVEVRAAPVRYHGRPAIQAAMRDVSERSRLEQRREAHRTQLEILARTAERVLAAGTAEEMMQRVVDAARELTGARIAISGHGYHEGRFRVGVASRAADAPPCPEETAFSVQLGGVYLSLIQGASTIRLSDAELRAQPSWWGLPEGHVPLSGLLGAQVRGAEGRPIGLIMASDKSEGEFTEDDEAILSQLASLASLALRHIEARTAAVNEQRRLEAVMEALPVGVAITDASGGNIRANRMFEQVWGGPRPATRSVDDYLHYRAQWVDSGRPLRPEEWASAQALARGEPVVGQLLEIEGFDGERRSVINSAAPVLDAQGNVAGSAVSIQDISELRRTEEALRAAHAELEERVRERTAALKQSVEALAGERGRFNEVLDRLPAYVVLLSPDYGSPFANRMFRERFGEPRGQRCFEHLFGRREPCTVCETFKALSTRVPVEWEWTGPDGRIYYVRDFPFTDTDGATLVLEMGLDITDRKHAEAELERHRRQLESLVQQRTGELQAVNATLEAELGERRRAEAELQRLNRTLKALSASNHALMHAAKEADFLDEVCRIVVRDCGYAMVWIGYAEEDEQRSVRPVAHAGFERGYLQTLKISWADTPRGRGPTGTAIRTAKPARCRNMRTDANFEPWREEAVARGYASSIAFPLLSEGRTFGALTIYSHEPDAFSREETALLAELADDLAAGILTLRLRRAHARAEGMLRQSEARYRALFNGMTEGFALHEVVCDAEGVPCDYRFLDINPAFERLTGLKREDVVGHLMTQVIPGEDPMWVRIYGEVALTGTPVRFEHYSEALKKHYQVFSFRPSPRQFAVVFLDVTERKQAEEELRQTDQRKTEFLAMLSHELRNPLAAVRNCLLILDRAEPGGGQARRAKAVVDRQVSQMVRLIDDLLDVTRISQGKIRLQRLRFDLAELVRRTVEDHRAIAVGEEPEIEVSIDERPYWVHGDPARVMQVVENLLQNATKFTRRDGHVRVRLEPEEGRQRAVIRVQDDGVGISAEMLPRLFRPFEQADITLDRTRGGLGLGLALVKGLTELHGGEVEARSEGQGAGAEFTVWLPLDEPGTAGPPPVRPAARGTTRRVLVIEDNVDAADSLREILQFLGHQVEVAYTGPDGLAVARGLKPEIVLCDIGLPGMDGYDVAQAFRLDPELRHAYLVALTGYALPEDMARARAAGFDQHLAKPVSLEQYELAIAKAPAWTPEPEPPRGASAGEAPPQPA